VRSTLRDPCAGRLRLAPVRRIGIDCRAPQRRAVAGEARAGAAAPAHAPRSLRTATHDRRRGGRVAGVDRSVTQLSLSNVSVEFGATPLFSGITLTVTRGQRWGIIGRNGSGKTTLLRLITGEAEPTSGTIARAGGLRWSIMEQHREFGGAATVWEAAAGAFAELRAL